MARRSSVDFLPRYLQTDTNRKFFNATFDQLISSTSLRKINGFVGKRNIADRSNDPYVAEPTVARAQYQLEPSVVVRDSDQAITSVVPYPEMVRYTSVLGSEVSKHNRLFDQDSYNYTGFVDLDKLINFGQYYWLPNGPDSVTVTTGDVPFTADFDVTRTSDGYTISGYDGFNPTITLNRGGSYNFNVNQLGTQFWIQTEPGTSGVRTDQENISTREVVGVSNNGDDFGAVTFDVPLEDAQDRFLRMDIAGNVSLATDLKFDDINNRTYGSFISEHGGIDGQRVLDNKLMVFLTPDQNNWFSNGQYDTAAYDTDTYATSVEIPTEQRRGIWRIRVSTPDDTRSNDYNNLQDYGTVDLCTTGSYVDLENVAVSEIVAAGGIDGVTDLENRTIVFVNDNSDTQWTANGNLDKNPYDTSRYDVNVGEAGAVSFGARYNVWKITYENIEGTDYIKLVQNISLPSNSKVNITSGNEFGNSEVFKNTNGFLKFTDPNFTGLLTRDETIKLEYVGPINVNQKVVVGEGIKYGNREIYKNFEGLLEVIDPITTPNTELYYQDSDNALFFGRIKLVNINSTAQIDVEADILSESQYTSPNGVMFTNGLKVRFDTTTVQSSYHNREYYVEGVGTAIRLVSVDQLVTPETWTQNLTEPFDTVAYDVGGYESTTNSPSVKDYITINRSSVDRNAWSRHNRWFHVDVIEATAQYNNYVTQIDQNNRAVRPILEYVADLKLFNYGDTAIDTVTVIDTDQTDAFSNVEGLSGYFVDSVELLNGVSVIWAADQDPDVAGTIYDVTLIDPAGTGAAQIHMTPRPDYTAQNGDTVLIQKGIVNQGLVYTYTGSGWTQGQQKTSVNQAPLFDIVDADKVSFGDSNSYNSSTFGGSQLFGYKTGTGTADTELGFALSYKSFTSVGDIEFVDSYESDSFVYVLDNTSVTQKTKSGYPVQITGRGATKMYNGWVKNVQQDNQYQILETDITTATNTVRLAAELEISQYPELFVSINGVITNDYVLTTQSSQTNIVFTNDLEPGTFVSVRFRSNTPEPNSYYEIPQALANNSDNVSATQFTLGQLRNHYSAIAQNNKTLSGLILGANNSRDIGNFAAHTGTIKKNSASVTPMGVFAGNTNHSVLDSVLYASREYIRFKNKFLDALTRLDLDYSNIPALVDTVLLELNGAKSTDFAFALSDMFAYGSERNTITYTVTDDQVTAYDITEIFNTTQPSYTSVLIYLNGVQLMLGSHYSFPTDRPVVEFGTGVLSLNDKIEIQEYTSTQGCYVPATPTKLGLYNSYAPEIIQDNTYVDPQTVIVGHDGSITPGFGDLRDSAILELELRIYNNLKTTYRSELFDHNSIKPGKYRNTDYTISEYNTVMSTLFYDWSGSNNVDFTTQLGYDRNNSFTWNYSKFTGTDDVLLLGHWRGIYNYWYDTDTPHTTPWQMLGFGRKPSWWENRYGPAPYTSGNLVLWSDLELGAVYDPESDTTTIDSKYARPGLLDVIPVDDYGQLKSPLDVLVKDYNSLDSVADYRFGDQGPAETAWRRSSAYPYALQILASLLKPAQYLGKMYDTQYLVVRSDLNQIFDTRLNSVHRFSQNSVHGIDNSYVEGYGQWISDYMVSQGRSTQNLADAIANSNIQLSYRVGGYTDKKYLKVITEQVSPDTANETVFVPDEDYSIVLHKSLPLARVSYSGVIVERTNTGYSVQGYDRNRPYFVIIPSRITGNRYTIESGTARSTVFRDAENSTIRIPYGYEFSTRDQVVDFLVSYQRYLEAVGFVFDELNETLGVTLDWILSAREFLFWTTQNWQPGSLITLSPASKKIKLERSFETADAIASGQLNRSITNLNGVGLDDTDFDVMRDSNTVTITTSNTQIGLCALETIQYEHVIVFENNTVFNDVIFQPELGNRQQRLKLVGFETQEWDGTLYAPGFILNQDNVKAWAAGIDYTKGDIVEYKGRKYTSLVTQAGSNSFVNENWSLLDNIKLGLLPNSYNKAEQSERFYDLDSVNLESDADRFGKGLIGYQKRDYLDNLGLDDVSQVKFYQGMIAEKGSGNSINKLTRAKFDNITNSVDYYEEWAIRTGSYGGSEINTVLDMALDENQFSSNPTIVELLDPGIASTNTSVVVNPNQLIKKSRDFDVDFLASKNSSSRSKLAAPTAGYVLPDDVDSQLFSVADIQQLNSELGRISDGYTVWTGVDQGRTWNVYRANQLDVSVARVTLDSNTRLLYFTSGNHGLERGDLVVVKNFVNGVEGVYTVLATPTLKSFTVDSFGNNIDFVGNGTLLKFTTVRVNNPKNIVDITPSRGWYTGDRVFVDKDADGRWTVLEKTMPWTQQNYFTASAGTAQPNDLLGSSVVLDARNLYALAGAPNLSTSGGVITYVRTANNELVQNSTVVPSNSVVSDFGASMDIGNGNYTIVGAPGTSSERGVAVLVKKDPTSSTFTEYQILAVPDDSTLEQFGTDVAMSLDERWIYVGAPGSNTVHMFGRIDVVSTDEEIQEITGDGSTTSFGLDVSASTVYAVQVLVDSVLQIPYINYDVVGSDIVFVSAPDASANVVIRTQTHWTHVKTIEPTSGNIPVSVPAIGDRFGAGITTTTSGDGVIVGSPNHDIDVVANVGTVYVYERSRERFIGDSSTTTFVTNQNINVFAIVTLDGVEITGYTQTSVNTIEFNTPPGTGTIIEIATNQVDFTQQIAASDRADSDEFGTAALLCPNDCSLYIGAPNTDSINLNSGSVYRYVNVPRNYNTVLGTVADATLVPGDQFHIKHTVITVPSADPQDLVDTINDANITGISAQLLEGKLSVTNVTDLVEDAFDMGLISGTVFEDLGIEIYQLAQKIEHPGLRENEQFGTTLDIDQTANTLVVGAPVATSFLNTTIDSARTSFDNNTLRFLDPVVNSGAVYVYEYLETDNVSILNPGVFTLTQQLTSSEIDAGDRFGSSVYITDNLLLVGMPYDDDADTDAGAVLEFVNSNRASGWNRIRSQVDVVDIDLINNIKLYNRRTQKVLQNLDFVDPIKGKIPGIAAQDLDYRTEHDPATYTVGNAQVSVDRKTAWGSAQLGQYWWDHSVVRFVEHEHENLDISSKLFNTVVDGSVIIVYEWIESLVTPNRYIDDNVDAILKYPAGIYSEASVYNEAKGIFETRYYFWAGNRSSKISNLKTLTSAQISELIENPQGQGVPYAVFLDTNAIALYNINNLLTDSDVVLSINYDKQSNEQLLHNEWALVQENGPEFDVPAGTLGKFVDSASGYDVLGNAVPDRGLSASESYGVSIRPRQSWFENRFEALKVYVRKLNSMLAQQQFAFTSNLDLLNAQEPVPTTAGGTYDFAVANRIELGYQKINELASGTTVLITNDDTVDNLWTIVELQTNNTWKIIRVQSYKTTDYWQYVDWTATGYSSNITADHVVDRLSDTVNINFALGDIVHVRDTGNSRYGFYTWTGTGLELIKLERGTIQILDTVYDYSINSLGFDNEVFDIQRFDEEPATETRKIVESVSNELLINENTSLFNDLMFSMLRYVLREQKQVDWLFKTSFISVVHNIRALDQFSVYQRDNQEFLLDYINEAKPYHTQVREYSLAYDKLESYAGDVTDFDVEVYYDSALGVYRKPNGDQFGDSDLQSSGSNSQWYNNRSLSVGSVVVHSVGSGYTIEPTVTVSAPDLATGTTATARARIRNGTVYRIDVLETGSGYINTPTVTITGGNGTGAGAAPRMINVTSRELETTLKFDRFTYHSGIVEWQPNTQYMTGDVVTYLGEAYNVDSDFVSENIFDAGNMSIKLDTDFDNAADRVAAYYTPGDNMPGIGPKNKVYSFVGDGSTDVYTLPTTIPSRASLNVRVDDPQERVIPEGNGPFKVYGTAGPDQRGAGKTGYFYPVYLDQSDAQNADLASGGTGLAHAHTFISSRRTFYMPNSFANHAVADTDAYDLYPINTVRPFNSYTVSGQNITLTAVPSVGSRITVTLLEKDLSQVIDNVEYSENLVLGPGFDLEPGFDVGAYDTAAYDNFEIGPEGVAILSGASTIDTELESAFTDSSLGVRPEDIIVDGAQFVDVYNSHAPEEMIPGRVYDTLDMTIFTLGTTGNALDENGLGIVTTTVDGNNGTTEFEFTGSLFNSNPDNYVVFSDQKGILAQNTDYTIDYNNKLITFNSAPLTGEKIVMYGFYTSALDIIVDINDVTTADTDTFTVERALTGAQQVIFVSNGRRINTTITKIDEDTLRFMTSETIPTGSYYRIIVSRISDSPENISSTLVTDVFENVGTVREFELDIEPNSDDPVESKMIVDVDGIRLRPPETVYHITDDSTIVYNVPVTGISDITTISPGDITVTLDNDTLEPNLDYVFTPSTDGSTLPTVTIVAAMVGGQELAISTATLSEFSVSGNKLILGSGVVTNTTSDVTVFTFTNHDLANIKTVLYQGAGVDTITTVTGYDGSRFDIDAFDTVSTTFLANTEFNIGRTVENSSYVRVTLNGAKLLPAIDFDLGSDNTTVVINQGLQIRDTDIIVITSFTSRIYQPAISYRQFTDMNGNTKFYRISQSYVTTLSKDLLIGDSEIFVEDAGHLSTPNPELAIPGVVFINGERITYYGIDRSENKLYQIRRGTAGTGARDIHYDGTFVADAGVSQLVPESDANSNVWYDSGVGSATNTLGLQASTSKQVKFLQSDKGVLPLVFNNQTGRYLVEGYVDEGYVVINT